MTSSSGSRASASRSRSERASPTTYSAFVRENPSAGKSRGSARATASRAGNSQATSCFTPKRWTKRPRIAAAARSEICWVVMATTSASNGRGFSVGRKPRERSVIGPRTGSRAAHSRKGSSSKGSPSSRETSCTASALAGSTRTPPAAASIRTSRPATTRWSPSSCHTVAPSVPKSRKRTVERWKSYGCGKRISTHSDLPLRQRRDVVEVLEALERTPRSVEVVGQAVAGEDARRRERDAAIREAVADVDELSEHRDIRALARLAADRARLGVAEARMPARPVARRRGWRRPRARDPRARARARSARGTRSRRSAGDARARTRANPSRMRTFSSIHATTSSSGARTLSNSSAITSCSVRSRPSRFSAAS